MAYCLNILKNQYLKASKSEELFLLFVNFLSTINTIKNPRHRLGLLFFSLSLFQTTLLFSLLFFHVSLPNTKSRRNRTTQNKPREHTISSLRENTLLIYSQEPYGRWLGGAADTRTLSLVTYSSSLRQNLFPAKTSCLLLRPRHRLGPTATRALHAL